ncbi:MAG: FAD-binding protein [Pseudomonadota bacterium]
MTTSAEATEEGLPLTDYSGRFQCARPEVWHQPTNQSALRRALREAYARGQPIRVRANGHSMNGQSLPRAGECLIDMTACRHFRFDRPGTVTVGAGAAVWDVAALVRSNGFDLLVVNDGGQAASSVGGFMAAGGFGESSGLHGGFWETVEQVRLIGGDGRDHAFGPDDAVFPWLFGSMGQLGVAWEFDLKIAPLAGAARPYPQGASGRVEASQPDWERIVWFTVFAPLDRATAARQDMIDIGVRHRHAWVGRWPYAYEIRLQRFNPPLVHPEQTSLGAVGIWGSEPEGGFDWEAMGAIERDVVALTTREPQYRRYIQTELRSQALQDYFSPDVWSRFMAHKAALDRAGLLNPL